MTQQEPLRQTAQQIVAETEKIIVGKPRQIQLILMAVLAQGHVLLDDLPGAGKTTLVKTLAKVLGCGAKRIQFTPDLLPSDILGMNVYNQQTGQFQRVQGPVMTHLLLADEINRAIPRTQSALLEAMEENQVTIDGKTDPLPAPFVVMATQNPVELESTFRLPAAQMDRFFLCLSLGYPDPAEEQAMLQNLGDEIPMDQVRQVASPELLLQLQGQVRQVAVAPALTQYIVALVQATRSHPLLRMGASPRASRALYRGAKAWAAMQGRGFATPDDVQQIAVPVLAHRLVPTSEARLQQATPAGIVQQLLAQVPVPPAGEERF